MKYNIPPDCVNISLSNIGFGIDIPEGHRLQDDCDEGYEMIDDIEEIGYLYWDD